VLTDLDDQLRQYDVTRATGFLVREPGMSSLPREAGAWEELVLEIPTLVDRGDLGRRINDLPRLRLPLEAPGGAQRAKLLLGMLAQAFVWEPVVRGGAARLEIPAQLAVPLVEVSRLLDEPPIFNYADFVLRDWALVDPEGELVWTNLAKRYLFTGDAEETGFATVHAEYEAVAGPAIEEGLRAVAAAEVEDVAILEQSLVAIAETITKMAVTFSKLQAAISPEFFRTQLRVFLQGWKNAADVVYQGTDVPAAQLRGETGAQSGALPFVDAVVGLFQPSAGGQSPSSTAALERPGAREAVVDYHDFAAYRPKPHRELIAHVRSTGNVRQVVSASRVASLTEAYNECVLRIREARLAHLRAVGAYLPPSADRPSTSLGTGGTQYAVYLRALLDTTAGATVS
jgi:indoleamine 2,3-dioxygenase